MKRQFVIEVDSAFETVFVHEVSKNCVAGDWTYTRLSDDAIIQAFPDPKFYGQLDALLLTHSRIRNAKPITPAPVEAVNV